MSPSRSTTPATACRIGDSKVRARRHDVDELLSEFALAHVEGSATVAAYSRDDLLEKRRPVMQAWADCISG